MYKNLSSIIYYQKKILKSEKEDTKILIKLSEKIEKRINECVSGAEKEILESCYICPIHYRYYQDDNNFKKIVDAAMSALIDTGNLKIVLFAITPDLKVQKILLETLVKSFRSTIMVSQSVMRDQWRLEFFCA
jgi:UDP-N-acetylglucosamine 2-epimerase